MLAGEDGPQGATYGRHEPPLTEAASPFRSAVNRPLLVEIPMMGPRLVDLRAELCGRTPNNRVVNFPGTQRLIGHFIDVNITAALPHSLRGAPVSAS